MYRFVKGLRNILAGVATVFSIIAVMVIDSAGIESGLFMVGIVTSFWVSFAIADRVLKYEKALRKERRVERVRVREAEEASKRHRRMELVSRADRAFDEVA